MQRRSNRHQLRLITEMSLTPLLNLALMLILVFVIASPLMHKGAAMPLPPGSSKPAEAPPSEIAKLTVDQNRAFSLDGQSVPPASLNNTLAKLHKDHPGTGVLVQIPRNLPVQVLVDLMDSLRQAGVQKTAVATLEK